MFFWKDLQIKIFNNKLLYFRLEINGTFIANFLKKAIMKIPTLLMASLLAVGVSAQNTQSPAKTKKPIKKVRKVANSDTTKKPKPTTTPKVIVRKDTVIHNPRNCPACGMG